MVEVAKTVRRPYGVVVPIPTAPPKSAEPRWEVDEAKRPAVKSSGVVVELALTPQLLIGVNGKLTFPAA